jgi:hypothetical protein
MIFSVLWCIDVQLIRSLYRMYKYDCITTFFLQEINKPHGGAYSLVEEDVVS